MCDFLRRKQQSVPERSTSIEFGIEQHDQLLRMRAMVEVTEEKIIALWNDESDDGQVKLALKNEARSALARETIYKGQIIDNMDEE